MVRRLPKDLQQIVERDAEAQDVAINPFAVEQVKQSEESFTSGGGELIKLPPERASRDDENRSSSVGAGRFEQKSGNCRRLQASWRMRRRGRGKAPSQ